MNASLVCIAVALSAAPADGAWQTIYYPRDEFTAAVRGQSPTLQYEEPYLGEPVPSPYYPSPQDPGFGGGAPSQPQPFFPQGPMAPQGPMSYDPFLAPPGTLPMDPLGGGTVFGFHGPQPYQLNRWITRLDVGFMPRASTSGPMGRFGIFEHDAELEYNSLKPNGWIFTFAQQFGLRAWDGPSNAPGFPIDLPGTVYRIGWNLGLATPGNHPLSAHAFFNPSINTDFARTLSSRAWNLDGRWALVYRVSPQFSIVGGALYWDRVRDRFLPYGGVIWTPSDRKEFRLLFPEARFSYLLGAPAGVATWFYARGEYNVEAYEIERTPIGIRDQVELRDWRILMGLRTDSGYVATFFEAGWVFGREVRFRRDPTVDFDVTTGFIARAGLRF